MILALILATALERLSPGAGSLTDTGLAEPTADVPGSFAEASAAFSARLGAAHPPGSAVADLVAALEADGFVVVDQAELPPGEGVARRERPGFLCDLVWIASWTEAGGAIIAIEGLHDGICL